MAAPEAKYILTAEDRTGKAFASVKAKFSTAASAAAHGAAGIAIAAVAGFGAMARQAINSGDEITKLSRVMGVSTEHFSQMKGVMDLVGGSFEQYVKGVRRMQRSVVDLGDGSKSMEEAFGSLGLVFADLQNLSPEDQLDSILRALEGVEDVTVRNARAQEIFGRSAESMLNLVGTGADEVARLRAEQEAMGNTLSGDAGQAMERFNDAIARMKQGLQGAVLSVVSENIDDIATAMESIVGYVPDMVRGVKAVATFAGFVGSVLGAGVDIVAGGAAAIGAAASGNFSGAGAVLNQVTSDVAERFTDDVVDEQQQTNEILREIARDGITARAG